MVRRLVSGLLLIMLLAGAISIPVDAAEITINYVNTKTISSFSDVPLDINPDGNGNLIISDNGYVIWKINPLNGAYTVYDTGIIYPVSDAHRALGSTEGYWFTNNVDKVMYTDLTKTYTWAVPYEQGEVGQSLGQLEIASSQEIWLIEYFSTKSKIHKVTRNSNVATVCTLVSASGGLDYGTWAYDMILRDNYLWWFNWSDDLIVRMNTTPDAQGKFTMEYWDTGIAVGAIEGRVLDFDQTGNLWIPGGGAGKIFQFNPTTEDFRTYSIPGTTTIEGVTVFGSQIVYADSEGSIGILNPLAAPSVTSNLSLNYHSEKLVIQLPCDPLEAVQTNNEATLAGTLPFTDRTIPLNTNHPGLTILPLDSDDSLTGINTAQGVVMVSNQKGDSPHIGQLLRFIPPPPTEFKVFLPLIKR